MINDSSTTLSPLVSICMPAYNAGKYIVDAVRSVIDQTYQNWELIIVNDGSSDDTEAVIKTLSDKRIILHSQSNQGQCLAANKAYQLSKGVFIKFLDADDVLSSTHLQEQVSLLINNENAIAYASWGRFYNDDITTFKKETTTVERDTAPLDWLKASMSGKKVMLQCGLWLIPKTVLDRSGLWNERLSLINDFEFFIRVLLCADKLIHTPGATLCYRSGISGSLSGTKTAAAAQSAYHSIDWGIQHLLARDDSESIKKIAADYFQDFIYTFYPFHRALLKKATQKVKEYGGSDWSFPAGGYTKVAVQLLGWKLTKRLKIFLTR